MRFLAVPVSVSRSTFFTLIIVSTYCVSESTTTSLVMVRCPIFVMVASLAFTVSGRLPKFDYAFIAEYAAIKTTKNNSLVLIVGTIIMK